MTSPRRRSPVNPPPSSGDTLLIYSSDDATRSYQWKGRLSSGSRPPPPASQRGGADLLRHAQAAPKLHRPLPTGGFPSLDSRVRRLAAENSQSQSVVDCAAAHERKKGNIGEKAVIGLDQSAESEQIDSSLTTPNTKGTVTEIVVSQNVGVNIRNRIASDTCNQSEFDTKSVLSYQLSSISGDKRSTLYSADNGRTRSSSVLDDGLSELCGM